MKLLTQKISINNNEPSATERRITH